MSPWRKSRPAPASCRSDPAIRKTSRPWNNMSVAPPIHNTGVSREYIHGQGRRHHRRQHRHRPGGRQGIQPAWRQGRHQRPGREDTGRGRGLHRRRYPGRPCRRVPPGRPRQTVRPHEGALRRHRRAVRQRRHRQVFRPGRADHRSRLRRDHGHQLQGGVLHGPESPAAAQGRRGGRHQYVRRGGDSRAERQRLCGQQRGARSQWT